MLAVYGRPTTRPQTDADARRLLHVRRQPAAPLPGRRRRRDLERAELEPLLAAAVRRRRDRASRRPPYEALLARCWDVLHAVRPGVNVIAASSPRGNDNPALSQRRPTRPSSSTASSARPTARAAGSRRSSTPSGTTRTRSTNAERPWVRHTSARTIGEGDYDKLMACSERRSAAPASPCPARAASSIWYMEQGFQTTVDPAKRRSTRGIETDAQALPSLASRDARPPSRQGPAPDQATQLSDALRVAYCQPGVAAFFNFELADEPSLAGWQSGLLWTDLTPKPSYQPFKAAVRAVASRPGRLRPLRAALAERRRRRDRLHDGGRSSRRRRSRVRPSSSSSSLCA